jgi:hypothetical protein
MRRSLGIRPLDLRLSATHHKVMVGRGIENREEKRVGEGEMGIVDSNK